MKKYIVVLLGFTFIASAALIAYAGHAPVVIPYENMVFGHKTMMPLAAGGDLRHHLIGHSLYKTWAKWPGKGEMYEGRAPHGAFLTTYVNDIALNSIKKMKGMENNAIIVKENYTPDKKLAAVTAMYKVNGYDSEGGDWFWVKYDDTFKILAEGKVKGCLDCHSAEEDNDYIFTGEVVK